MCFRLGGINFKKKTFFNSTCKKFLINSFILIINFKGLTTFNLEAPAL